VRYWCIRHDRDEGHEISGGYIWLPKKNPRQTSPRYSEPVLSIAAGDGILSRAGGVIGHVGRASEQALGEPGRQGEGWWLPVDWTPLPDPVASGPKPRTRLAEIPPDLFRAILSEGGLEGWPLAAPDDPAPSGLVAASRLDYDGALAASVRDQLVRARRGQGLFRFRVFQLEAACRLTGIARPDLLIASHIKPWRLCETTHERLDGANGLLLTPHVDRLFDRGLISFSDDGAVLRSPALTEGDLRRLGLDAACRGNVGAFSERQRRYLDYHRGAVFAGRATQA
jgi:hypothetical protein